MKGNERRAISPERATFLAPLLLVHRTERMRAVALTMEPMSPLAN
jgi:hypothetical protein